MGRIGSYMGKEEASREGYVFVKYIPLNSVMVNKPVKFDNPVPDEAVIPVEPVHTDKPGVQSQYVIVTENDEGKAPLRDKIGKLRKERIADFREQVRDKEVEVEQHKVQRQKAEQGQAEIQKEDEEMSNSPNRSNNVNIDEW